MPATATVFRPVWSKRLIQPRRCIFPFPTALSKLKAQLEKLRHVSGVECLCTGIREIGRDVSEVICHVVATGELIHLIKIADALGLDQSRNRPSRDRQCAGFHRLKFGSDAPIANDVEATDWANAKLSVRTAGPNLCRQQEHLIGSAPIDMHFLSDLSLDMYLDIDWREHARNRRRGKQHIAK